MQITSIEKQKKDKNRYNIYIDGEFAFGLYEDTMLKFGLRSADKLDEDRIESIRKFDELAFGKKVAYKYLSYKQRSKKDVMKKLKEKKIPSIVIDEVILLLQEQKYVDDNAYAKNYLDEKIKSKPAGKSVLRFKLLEKGIDKETAETEIENTFKNISELDLAKSVLKKYEKKVKYKDNNDRKSKCYRYLASKGFDYDVIRNVMNTEI